MTKFSIKTFGQKHRKWVLVLSMASLIFSGPIGCSLVPDWADPVEWYGDTKDWVLGELKDTAKQSKTLKPIPGINKSFPKLSSVPMRPARPSKAKRKKMARKLVADREAARYDDSKTRKPEISSPLAPVTMVERPLLPKGLVPVIKKQAKKRVNNSPQLVFGEAPADIIMNQKSIAVKRPKMPDTTTSVSKAQSFVQAKPFTIRFPAGTENILRPVLQVRGSKVASVLFETGSKSLSRKARKDIRKAADLFKQRGGSIYVVGHASSLTRNMAWRRHHFVNLQLSHDRAHTVAGELRRQGVEATAIRVSAISNSQPAFSEVVPAEAAGNRRVEILIEN